MITINNLTVRLTEKEDETVVTILIKQFKRVSQELKHALWLLHSI